MQASLTPNPKAMTALGNNVHLFARPHRRQELAWCFETVLGGGPVTTVQHPGMAEPMLLVRFPGGGNLSIEFVEEAPTTTLPGWKPGWNCGPSTPGPAAGRLGRWSDPGRAPRPSLLLHGTGGQVFTIAPQA